MLLVLFIVRLAIGYQFQSAASTAPQLVEQFGLSYAQVGSLIGFFLLPGIFFAVLSGALTRATTDKNLLIVGAVAMLVGAVVMGLAESSGQLYAGRLETGLSGNGTYLSHLG